MRPILEKAAKELGTPVYALAKAPAGDALKLQPIRIGLYDSYGGSMPSGWTRWLFEQYEMPFQVVYPPMLDAGDLKSKFDVIVFVGGALPGGGNGRGGGRGGRGGGGRGANANVPEEYRGIEGRISEDQTVPALKKFVELGGLW